MGNLCSSFLLYELSLWLNACESWTLWMLLFRAADAVGMYCPGILLWLASLWSLRWLMLMPCSSILLWYHGWFSFPAYDAMRTQRLCILLWLSSLWSLGWWKPCFWYYSEQIIQEILCRAHDNHQLHRSFTPWYSIPHSTITLKPYLSSSNSFQHHRTTHPNPIAQNPLPIPSELNNNSLRFTFTSPQQWINTTSTPHHSKP